MRSYSARVAAVERMQRRRRCRGDGVEDPEQRVAARRDQLGVVEVVAGVEADALRQPAADGDLALRVEQRDLDAVDLGGMLGDDRRARPRSPRRDPSSPSIRPARDRTCRRASAGSPGGRAGAAPRRRPRGSRRAMRRSTASARLAMTMTCAPSASTSSHWCSYAARTSSSVRGSRVVGRRPRGQPAAAPRRPCAGSARAPSGQSSPMPRWAVSIASATPSPCAHRCRRKASVASQSTPPAGSATTCAAAKATRVEDGGSGSNTPGSPGSYVRPPGSTSAVTAAAPRATAARATTACRARRAARRAPPRGSPTGTARRARRGAGSAPTAP